MEARSSVSRASEKAPIVATVLQSQAYCFLQSHCSDRCAHAYNCEWYLETWNVVWEQDRSHSNQTSPPRLKILCSVLLFLFNATVSLTVMVDVDGVWLDRKQKNTLPLYGNKETMNLNSMIRTNILGSPYFKEDLFQFKTFHEVVDEIYYKVGN